MNKNIHDMHLAGALQWFWFSQQTIVVKKIDGMTYILKNRYGPLTPQAAMGLKETNVIISKRKRE